MSFVTAGLYLNMYESLPLLVQKLDPILGRSGRVSHSWWLCLASCLQNSGGWVAIIAFVSPTGIKLGNTA